MNVSPYVAGAICGAFLLGGGIGGAAFASDGLFPDPYRCGGVMQEGRIFWQSGPLDDEGFSEGWGDLRRAGWEIVDSGKNSRGYFIEARCTVASSTDEPGPASGRQARGPGGEE